MSKVNPMISKSIRAVMRRTPYLRSVANRLDYLEYYERFCPLGHYYSPIPSIEDVRHREREIFDRTRETLPGIDLNPAGQRALLGRFAGFYADWPYRPGRDATGLRYTPENDFFRAADALCLYGMIRDARPRRIIEVGSGFSSALTLDVNDLFCDGAIDCTFIDPSPERLESMLKPGEKERTRIFPARLQDVDKRLFDELGENDILFIDSSHVSKTDSDVNHLMFQVLPRLARGVIVHVHDIPYPFEYSADWIYGGRSWNEAYLVRAFLTFNSAFRIECFISYLQNQMSAALEAAMPLAMTSEGQSLWLKRVE
jgi:hypothetical protein